MSLLDVAGIWAEATALSLTSDARLRPLISVSSPSGPGSCPFSSSSSRVGVSHARGGGQLVKQHVGVAASHLAGGHWRHSGGREER